MAKRSVAAKSQEDKATTAGADREVGTESPPRTHWIQAIQTNDIDALKLSVDHEIRQIIERFNLHNYVILLLFDEVDSISAYHSDRIYSAARNADLKGKDILLIINSRGGSIEPAYLISKTLKRLSDSRFIVAVPRLAKSAATLISLGADEIHMGLMSQLGPIDPQIGGLPALALGNALDVLADLASRFPGASDLLTNFLNLQTSIRMLGYYQRVNESAVQYAERLLMSKELPPGKTSFDVANHMVNHYKDHGFVIDFDEAKEVLGGKIVLENTIEYQAADEIYSFLDLVGFVLRTNGQDFWYVGTVDGGLYTRPRKEV